MIYRVFKGIKISEVGLGTWQLGSTDWGHVKGSEALGILQAFSNAGGNFIDTSDVYGAGVSERIIGQFLKSTKNETYIASKLGRRQDGSFGWPQNFTYDMMRLQVESSLKNLDLPQLFLEQLHCIPIGELRAGRVFDHLRRLQQENLIRFWGASVETSEEALLCLEQDGIASLQVIFNLFRQHVADEIFAKAKEKEVAIIVRVPLASGLLTGRFNEKTHFPASDHRHFNANGESFNAGETFSGIEFSRGLELADKISGMMPGPEISKWAIRWILDHPEVTTVIPGATKIKQVEDNMAASDLPALDEATHQKLRSLYDQKIKPFIRGHY